MIRLIGISLVLINLVACQDFASEIEVNKCPTVTSAQTFKLDEYVVGDWFLFATSVGNKRVFPTENTEKKCIKVNYRAPTATQLVTTSTFTEPAGSPETINEIGDAAKPGVFRLNPDLTIDIKDVIGSIIKTRVPSESSIVYYDDKNIHVRYSCVQVKNFWFADTLSYFEVYVRDRKFNDMEGLKKALEPLRALDPDLDDLVFLDIDSCTN